MDSYVFSGAANSSFGFTHRFIIEASDLTAEATTQVIELVTVTADTIVEKACCIVKTQFDGDVSSELTMQLGLTGGTTDLFMPATSVHADATPVDYFVTAYGTTDRYIFTAGDTIDALFTATDANLDLVTTGRLQLYLAVQRMSTLNGILI